jgi:hypothetical protein
MTPMNSVELHHPIPDYVHTSPLRVVPPLLKNQPKFFIYHNIYRIFYNVAPSDVNVGLDSPSNYS